MGGILEAVKKYKYILGFTLIMLLGFILYSVFFAGSGEPAGDALVTTNPAQSEVEAATVDLLALLLSLKTLDIDVSLFSDDRFRSLTDFSVELIPQQVGRQNPFLPIGGTGGSSSSRGFGAQRGAQ